MKNQKKMIMHMDGDAFFASVEQAKNWRLCGKPVVTGGERYIAASMSYEAKARGVTRGMRLSEIKKVCPEAIIVPSDYITYSIFARRMFEVVRSFGPTVEEYSIDECFADITGLDKKFNTSYENVVRMIKDTVERKLGITFGVGVGPTKVLAKIGSKFKKPAGLTMIPLDEEDRLIFLKQIQIEKVWGIGTATTKHLRAHGIMTAYDFATMPTYQLQALKIAKPYRQIQFELQGSSVLPVVSYDIPELRPKPKSIMCSRTFTPPSKSKEMVISQLSKNIEDACERLRHIDLLATACTFFLKTQDFRYQSVEYILPVPSSDTSVFTRLGRDIVDSIFKHHVEYRATGITLRQFIDRDHSYINMPQLFDIGNFDGVNIDKNQQLGPHFSASPLYSAVDRLNRRFGSHTISLASSMHALGKVFKFKNENAKKMRHSSEHSPCQSDESDKHWELPFLGIAK